MKPEDHEAMKKAWQDKTSGLNYYDFIEGFECALAHRDAQPAVAVDHSGLIKRIDAAIERVTQGRGLMSIPANPRSDVDLVLCECKALLQGENPPFWATNFHPAVAVNDQLQREAARYRWLRDNSVPPHNFYLSVPVEFDGVKYTPQEVDNYIDAAIAGAEKAKGGV